MSGPLAGVRVSPDGRVVSEAEWARNVREWLPSDEDRAFVASLMGRVVDPGRAIVGNAGVLLARVEYVKRGAEKNFLVVDAAMNVADEDILHLSSPRICMMILPNLF